MEKRTLNNLAILKIIELDATNILETEWDQQILLNQGYKYEERNYVPLDFFSGYFQNLINRVSSIVGPYKNICLQTHDKRIVSAKFHLNIIHNDAKRLSCVTIPLLYSSNEPVNFYANDGFPRGTHLNRKAQQRVSYSRKHPNLMNTCNFHNVRVSDDISPRVLLQLSYDVHFDEIISKNPDYWEIM
jgi:hypothetical protein